MRITIERGNRRYEVVPCGRRCGFYKPERVGGREDFCSTKCHCPAWFRAMAISNGRSDCDMSGLREIGGAK